MYVLDGFESDDFSPVAGTDIVPPKTWKKRNEESLSNVKKTMTKQNWKDDIAADEAFFPGMRQSKAKIIVIKF